MLYWWLWLGCWAFLQQGRIPPEGVTWLQSSSGAVHEDRHLNGYAVAEYEGQQPADGDYAMLACRPLLGYRCTMTTEPPPRTHGYVIHSGRDDLQPADNDALYASLHAGRPMAPGACMTSGSPAHTLNSTDGDIMLLIYIPLNYPPTPVSCSAP